MRSVVSFLSRPWILGALYVVVLAIRAATKETAEERALGRQAKELTSFIKGQFGAEILRVGLAIVSAAVLVGLVVGVLAGALLWLRRAGRGEPKSLRRRVVENMLAVVLVHGAFILVSMVDTPQLYAEEFYAPGGLTAALMVFVTDTLSTKGVLAVIAVGCMLGTLGSPRHWVRRGRAIAARATPLRLALGALLVLIAGLLWLRPASGWTQQAARRGAGGPMNVLLLAADSVRWDRVVPEVAPNLTALASRSATFDRAYVSLPRTFPSWVTILTGRHPHTHGVRTMFPRWEDRTKDFDALPKRLRQEGYRTWVTSDYAGDIFGRIDLGFDTVDTPSFDFRVLVRQRALERQWPLLPFLHSRAGRWVFPVMTELNHAADPHMLGKDVARALDAVQSGPFFLTVFYSTAHFPYAAPSPYYRLYTDPKYRGRFKYHKPVGLGSEAPPDADDEKQIRALYDGSIRAIDDAIGALLRDLVRRGLDQNTIVVFTADHGETLYEDGHGQGHGNHLFGDGGIHVPFIVHDPRVASGSRHGFVVRDADLAPTLYELLGLSPAPGLDGRSLAPSVRGGTQSSTYAFAETELWFTDEISGLRQEFRLPYPGIAKLTEIDRRHGDDIVLQKAMMPVTTVARHRMVRDERYKLIYIPTRDGVRYLLFDTVNDPRELRDIAKEQPSVVERLKTELWSYMLRDPEMMERGGYLVPRDLSALTAPADVGIRLGNIVPDQEPPVEALP